jgi:hypothetical protein
MGVLDMTDFEDQQHENAPPSEVTKSQSVVNNLCMGLMIGDEAEHKHITVVQLLKGMCRSNAAMFSEPSRLQSWVAHNASRRIGDDTLEDHLDRYIQDHARQNPSVTQKVDYLNDIDAVERAQSVVENGFEMLARLRMTFVVTGSGRLRIVYRDARPGDHLFILQNCPLLVVLRQTSGPSRFKFMGEVFASDNVRETRSTLAGSIATIRIE